MTLRSGTTLWQAVGDEPLAAPPLSGDVHCDVAILGSGVTGALIAERFSEAGVDAVVIDKRDLGAGSTAASTGLLQYEVDTPLSELISMIGEAHAVQAYARGLRAIDELEALTAKLPDNCGFNRRESLYFASHRWHARRLRREFECRKEHGFGVELIEKAELAEISTLGAPLAIRSRGDAQIDPYRFTQHVLRRAQGQGARLFAHTEINDVGETTEGTQLRAATGTIRAKKMVYATGYDLHQSMPENLGTLHSTYAVASEPIPRFDGWPEGMLLWETARPYFYARQTSDGRAIIGGEDTAFASDHQRDGLQARKTARLVKRFARLFPDVPFEPAFAWAGTFGESHDGLAYIGPAPDRAHAYVAMGYGGNGITFSMIAARLIVDLYFNRPNADAEVFRLDR